MTNISAFCLFSAAKRAELRAVHSPLFHAEPAALKAALRGWWAELAPADAGLFGSRGRASPALGGRAKGAKGAKGKGAQGLPTLPEASPAGGGEAVHFLVNDAVGRL